MSIRIVRSVREATIGSGMPSTQTRVLRPPPRSLPRIGSRAYTLSARAYLPKPRKTIFGCPSATTILWPPRLERAPMFVSLEPAAGLVFAFDSTNNGRDGIASWESHSVDRTLRVAAGSYQVIVQAVTSTTTIFRLD